MRGADRGRSSSMAPSAPGRYVATARSPSDARRAGNATCKSNRRSRSIGQHAAHGIYRSNATYCTSAKRRFRRITTSRIVRRDGGYTTRLEAAKSEDAVNCRTESRRKRGSGRHNRHFACGRPFPSQYMFALGAQSRLREDISYQSGRSVCCDLSEHRQEDAALGDGFAEAICAGRRDVGREYDFDIFCSSRCRVNRARWKHGAKLHDKLCWQARRRDDATMQARGGHRARVFTMDRQFASLPRLVSALPKEGLTYFAIKEFTQTSARVRQAIEMGRDCAPTVREDEAPRPSRCACATLRSTILTADGLRKGRRGPAMPKCCSGRQVSAGHGPVSPVRRQAATVDEL